MLFQLVSEVKMLSSERVFFYLISNVLKESKKMSNALKESKKISNALKENVKSQKLFMTQNTLAHQLVKNNIIMTQ